MSETRVVQIPGQKAHTIIIEQGSAPLARPSLGQNVVDSTVRDADYSREGQQAELARQREQYSSPAPSQIRTDVTADPAAEVKVGVYTLRPNPVFGTTEAAFTRGGAEAFQVLDADGDPMTASEGLAALYAALRAPKGKGK